MSPASTSPGKGRRLSPDPELWEEMMRHPGKWIVADDTKIIAVCDDGDDLLAIADAAGVEVPFIFRVPDDLSEAWLF